MFKAVFLGLGVAVTFAIADPLFALGEDGKSSTSYNVSIKGIRAGRMNISSNVVGQSYGAAMSLRSTGIVAALAKFRFEASSSGTLTGAQGLTPQRYNEKTVNASRQEQMTMRYSNGTPSPSVQAPAPALKASTQKGTIDPMSGIFAVFRDQNAATLCTADHIIFDGKRRTRLKLRPGATPTTCEGTFTRLGGFSDAKLAQGTTFPLSISYTQVGDNFQVQRLTIQSARGRAVFSRR